MPPNTLQACGPPISRARLGSRPVFGHAEPSLRGAIGRRETPVFRRAVATKQSSDRRAAAAALDCFASLAMTMAPQSDRELLTVTNPVQKRMRLDRRSQALAFARGGTMTAWSKSCVCV